MYIHVKRLHEVSETNSYKTFKVPMEVNQYSSSFRTSNDSMLADRWVASKGTLQTLMLNISIQTRQATKDVQLLIQV
jgi:hypothetical protein